MNEGSDFLQRDVLSWFWLNTTFFRCWYTLGLESRRSSGCAYIWGVLLLGRGDNARRHGGAHVLKSTVESLMTQLPGNSESISQTILRNLIYMYPRTAWEYSFTKATLSFWVYAWFSCLSPPLSVGISSLTVLKASSQSQGKVGLQVVADFVRPESASTSITRILDFKGICCYL